MGHLSFCIRLEVKWPSRRVSMILLPMSFKLPAEVELQVLVSILRILDAYIYLVCFCTSKLGVAAALVIYLLKTDSGTPRCVSSSLNGLHSV